MNHQKVISNDHQESKSAKTFVYNMDDTSKIFPIDCSVNELQNKYGWDSRAIQDHFINSSLFKDALCQLYQPFEPDADKKKQFQGSQIAKTPLPIEILPFMRGYFKLRDDPNYKKALFRNYNKRKRPSVNTENLAADLSRNIYREIESPDGEESDPSGAYCRQVLFENETFASVILSDLWDEQINARITTLRSLLSDSNTDIQFRILGDCLLALDQCISKFSHSKHEHSDKPSSEQAVVTMLDQLLKSRKAMIKQDGRSVDYIVENIKVLIRESNVATETTVTLHDAFNAIKNRYHPVDPSYLAATRKSYLQHLAESNPSSTEEEYRKIRNYLSWISTPADLNQLTDQLTEWTEDWCREVAVSCIGARLIEDVPDFDLSQHGYVGDLVTKLARDFMKSTLDHFSETVYMIRLMKTLEIFAIYQKDINYFRCSKLIKHQRKYFRLGQSGIISRSKKYILKIFSKENEGPPEAGKFNISLEFAVQFYDFLEGACAMLYGKDVTIFTKEHRVNILAFVQNFYPATACAAKHYYPQYIHSFSPERIVQSLMHLTYIISHSDEDVSFYKFIHLVCIPLLDGLLLQLLHRIQSDCLKFVSEAVSFVSQNLTGLSAAYPKAHESL